MWAHPGKKLLFMGGEFGQVKEWDHETSLEWHVFFGEEHGALQKLVGRLNQLYVQSPALYAHDHESSGFQWLDANDGDNSIFAFVRIGATGERLYCVVNATPVARPGYRLGVLQRGSYREVLNTDATDYAGSNVVNVDPLPSESIPWHDQPHSIALHLPPLAAVYLAAE
jgi:1,4-alpha-glucan branching enzyme